MKESTMNDLIPAYLKNTMDVATYTYFIEAYKRKHHSLKQNRFSEADFDEVLKVADEIVIDSMNVLDRTVVFHCGEVICRLYCSLNNYQWIMASDDRAKIESLEEKLYAVMPEIAVEEDGLLPLSFWTNSSARGIVCRNRKIEAPDWSDIQHNYPSEVGAGLSKLMDMKPGKSGQLILFHGTPGTGKSYAIRALLKHWNDWCEGDYIIDPEAFFGGNADYMIEVLLSNDRGDADDPENDKWHLYVIEDSDELLTTDAKARAGQALSRLLNVVDGMIGQGLRLIVLVTTNEPMDSIHPAVKRPGRCLANIEFRKFNVQEAGIWLNGDADKIITTEDKTLAELYFEHGDIQSVLTEANKSETPIGFGG